MNIKFSPWGKELPIGSAAKNGYLPVVRMMVSLQQKSRTHSNDLRMGDISKALHLAMSHNQGDVAKYLTNVLAKEEGGNETS